MTKNLRRATLLFLRKDQQILLAMKKRGFGQGRWNGVGGKLKANETVEQAAVRECSEEIGVNSLSPHQVAVLTFHFPPDKAALDQQVHVFFCDEWEGEPVETEEMNPQWFAVAQIPYKQMWPDDEYWLPLVIDGKHLEAEFHFDDNDQVLKQKVKQLS